MSTSTVIPHATKRSPRSREAGDGKRRSREQAKPSVLDAPHSSSDSTAECEDDIRYDYELRDPFSLIGAVIIAAGALLFLILVIFLVSISLLN